MTTTAMIPLVLAAIAVGGGAVDPAVAAAVTESARALVEPGYREANGHGFASFRCELRRRLAPGASFDCDAADPEGRTVRYTLAVDGEGQATVALVTVPASRLAPAERARLEPPGRAFLDAWSRGAWAELHAALHPALRAKVGLAELRAALEGTREALGELRSAGLRSVSIRTAAGSDAELPEAVFALDAARGPGFARFRVELDGEAPKVTAYRVAPAPGSPLEEAVLEKALREMLGGLVGEPVRSLAAPLGRLEAVGDSVEGTALLASGREMPVRVEQSGREDDFDRNDYRCQVLDAPWLVARMLAARGERGASVDCPSRVVPDGESQVCRATLPGGERIALAIHRRAGEHRVTAVDPGKR